MPETSANSGWARRAGIAAVAFSGLFAVFLGAWAIDTSLSSGVARNVWLAEPGEDPIALQQKSVAQVREVAQELTSELGQESTIITIGSVAVRTDLVRLGASIDADALVGSAFEARQGSLPSRPFSWAASFFRPITVDVPYTIEAKTTEAAVSSILVPALDSPLPPTVRLVGDVYQPVPGTSGVLVSPAALLDEVERAVSADPPHDLRLTALPQPPDLSLDEVGAVALELNRITGSPLEVTVLAQTEVLEPAILRGLITIQDKEAGPTWEVIQSKALEILRPSFTALGGAEQQARFIVVQDKPVIVPALESVVCCDDSTAELIRDGLLAEPVTPEPTEENPNPLPELRSIELSPRITNGDAGVAELEALGVVEMVSTFETAHTCCQGRVTNIHLFADSLRGALIRPGETLSLNAYVGKRTEETGFVPAGAILDGILEPQVGGGVSQIATTTFNAAFFAGLEFPEYQAHSLYFSRYPRGREATISWPKPDLKIKNPTPYGVVIWTEYTDTTITVSVYSTKHIDVTDAGTSERKQGVCTRVTTTRERKYQDGTVDTDTVFALYREKEGFDCNGNPTRPEDEPIDDEPPPTTQPPTTQPPPPETTTTAAPTTTVPPTTTTTEPATTTTSAATTTTTAAPTSTTTSEP